MSLDILAIGAHPDDVEIAAGGTLIKMRSKGYSATICDLTDGEPTPLGSRETRLEEAALSAETIGVARITLDMPNRYLEDTLENRRKLALLIRQLRPRLILAPYTQDDHPDHIAASAISRAARFYAKLTKTDMHGNPWPGDPWWAPAFFYYLGLAAYRRSVEPSFLVDISAEYERKMRALASYQTQKTTVERLARCSVAYGPLINSQYAEAFYSPGPIVLDDLFLLK